MAVNLPACGPATLVTLIKIGAGWLIVPTATLVQPFQSVTVTVDVSDRQGIAAATLWYAVNGAAWQTRPMFADANQSTYAATIPGQLAAAAVQFYVETTDGAGAKSTFPAAARNSRALYKVNDNQAGAGRAHTFRIIMTAADYGYMLRDTNLMSNELLGATIVYREREVFYDCPLRLRGSPYGRPLTEAVSYDVEFPAEKKFRGIHESVAVDRSGLSPIGRGSQDEILTKHIILHAGRLPGMYDDVVRVLAPQAQHTGGALLLMARYGSVFLDSQFDHGSDGYVYKYDVVHTLTQTAGGSPEGVKITVPDALRVDIQDLGDSKENYRWNFQIENHRRADHFDELIPFCKAFSLSGIPLSNAIGEVMDVDEWMRVFALESLVGVTDTYANGSPHNLQMYASPSDHRILALPYDLDGNFSQDAGAPLWSQEITNLKKIIELPSSRRLFYGHLQEMLDTTYNAAYMRRWADHYGGLAGENYSSLVSYITSRGAFVRAALPALAPFQISTNASELSATNGASVVIRGAGAFDVRRIYVAGLPSPLVVTWIGTNSWEAIVPVAAGQTVVNFRAFDAHDNLVGSASITVTNPVPAVSVLDALRLTELMYHPSAPPPGSVFNDEDFEFLELQNISASPLNLGGVNISAGVDFTFPNTILPLAAGQYALVVNNRAAFATRYDTNGLFIVDEFSGNLSNGGERIRLNTALGQSIHDFTYQDAWYPETDGSGYSLVIRDPLGPLTGWNASPGWKSSAWFGGTPGRDDSRPPRFTDSDRDGISDEWEMTHGLNPLVNDGDLDPDGDGMSNWAEYQAGTNPRDPSDTLRIIDITYDSGLVSLRFLAKASRSYTVLTGPTPMPSTWEKLADVAAQPGDHLETVTHRPAGSSFYRLVTPWVKDEE